MYSEEKIVLKIRARGNVELRKIIDFLKDFESAYNRIYTISNFSGDARFFPDFSERTGKVMFQKGEISPFKYELKFASESEIKNSIPQQDILLLKRVVLESPGVWEIIGSLNPLETIRKFINDHDNRKKDRDLHPHRVRSAELDVIEKEDNDEGNGNKDGPYCPTCFDNDNKSIRLQKIVGDEYIETYWNCNVCNSKYYG